MHFIFILLGWIAGISMMGSIFPSFIKTLGILAALIGLILAFCHFFKFAFSQTFLFKIVQTLSLTCGAVIAGYYYSDHALEKRLQHRIQQVSETSILVYVDQIDKRSNVDGNLLSRQKVRVLTINAQDSYDVLLYLNDEVGEKGLGLGQYYRVSGKLKPAHSYAVDGVFDQEKWFIQQNVMGTMQVKSTEIVSLTALEHLGFQSFVQQQSGLLQRFKLFAEKNRVTFRQFIEKQPLKNKGLLLALLTGDESLLSPHTEDQFRVLGISHLLAISGPHVLIFAVIFCFVVNFIISKFWPQLFLNIPRPYFLLLPFFACVVLYTAFVGFEIPAMRTCLTVLIVSVALIFKQHISALKLLLLSASLLLLIDPFSILSAAFWLSYGACFILIRVYQTIVKKPILQDQKQLIANTRKTQIWFWIKALVDSQWKIFIALFPLIALIFQQVSWIAPLVNLIAIPMISLVIVPLEVIGACISIIFEPLGLLFFHLADWGISFLLACLKTLQDVFQVKLTWLALRPWVIVSLTLGVIILLLPARVFPKSLAILCFIPLWLGAKDENKFELNILDVGQGQAIFLNLPQQKVLIDTGGYYDETKFSVGERIVIPYLMRRGITHLDKVILSHLDQDHAGAFEAINKEISIAKVYSNQQDQRFQKNDFHYCHAGQEWQFDQVKMTILSPEFKDQSYLSIENQNENSCVVYIQILEESQYQNFLIMGDAGWETEYKLLQRYPNLKVDVLVLGHHGSQHSSAYGFLKQLNPQMAIASAGFNNRYRHPHPIVLSRLEALSIPFQSTIDQGSIQFILDQNKQWKVNNHRHQKKWLMR